MAVLSPRRYHAGKREGVKHEAGTAVANVGAGELQSPRQSSTSEIAEAGSADASRALQQIESLEARVDDLETKATDLEGDRDRLRSEIERVESEADQAQRDMDLRVIALEGRLRL